MIYYVENNKISKTAKLNIFERFLIAFIYYFSVGLVFGLLVFVGYNIYIDYKNKTNTEQHKDVYKEQKNNSKEENYINNCVTCQFESERKYCDNKGNVHIFQKTYIMYPNVSNNQQLN